MCNGFVVTCWTNPAFHVLNPVLRLLHLRDEYWKSGSISYQRNVKPLLSEILSGAQTQTLQATKAVQGFMGMNWISLKFTADHFIRSVPLKLGHFSQEVAGTFRIGCPKKFVQFIRNLDQLFNVSLNMRNAQHLVYQSSGKNKFRHKRLQ